MKRKRQNAEWIIYAGVMLTITILVSTVLDHISALSG